MKRVLSFFTAFVLLLNTAFATDPEENNGIIRGTVATSEGKPAAEVSILLKGTAKGTITNGEGAFEIRKLAAGTYTVVASLQGFEGEEQTVTVAKDETATISFTLKLDAKQLEQVIITSYQNKYVARDASSSLRLAAPLLEVPQNIQVVTTGNLRDQQIISLSDGVLRNVSGVVRLEHWGDMYAQVYARGSQVQAFRNGFNIVNSYWGPLTEDMSFVEGIEFVKGPAGFMLSTGDPAGLYNVVTKKPTGITKGEVSFTAGSFNLYRTTLDLDGKLSKDGRLLYRLNLAAQNKKSHRANEYNDRYVIAPVISYQLDDKTKLTFEYIYQRAAMSNVGSYYIFAPNGYATTPVEATLLPAGIPGTKMNDHSFYANIQHDINSKWKLTGQLARFMYNQEGSSAWPSVVNGDGTIIRNISIWDAKSSMTMGQLFLNGDVTTGAVRHRILTGLDVANKSYMADWSQSHDLDTANAEFDPLNPNLGFPVNGYPVFDRSRSIEERANAASGLIDQTYTGFYLQDELGFWNNKLRLTLAGRYTHIKQSAYGAAADKAARITPRIGLSASITPALSVYALYDQAFVPQSGNLSNGGKVQPVTGNNQEIGLKKDWFGGRWNTTLAVYRILKNNELTADPNSAPTSGLSIELGQKTSKGVEFDLRGTIARGLSLVANYAYTDSRITKVNDTATKIVEGTIVPGYATHTANAWLNYRIRSGTLKGLGFSTGFTFLGDRQTYWDASPDPGVVLPDYFKLDAGISWEGQKLSVTANVFNVLDKYLYSGSYYKWLPAYYWQTDPPRNARLTFAYKF